MEQSGTRSTRGIGETIRGAVGGAIDTAFGTALSSVGRVGRLLRSSLRLPGQHRPSARAPRMEPGAPPGIAHISGVDRPPEQGTVDIRCIDYGGERVESRAVQVADLNRFLSEPVPDWVGVRWINVSGLHPYVVDRVCESLGFHILSAEDVFQVPQRPRMESYDDHLFIVTRIVGRRGDVAAQEQVSMFLKPGLLVTFQESREEIWESIEKRLGDANARIRGRDASYLAYALLDAVVDHGFPVLERYGEALEEIEEAIVAGPTPGLLPHLHAVKRELAVLRKIYWPTRELVGQLSRVEESLVSEETRTYLRDVYDHSVQILDIIETFRDTTSSLTDLHISITSNRTNEVMRVLTVMATLFIPATFLAGVYGMNFQYIPELGWRHAYPVFWAVCLTMFGGLLFFFRRRGWLG